MTWLRDRWHILELNEILWNFVIRFRVSTKQEGELRYSLPNFLYNTRKINSKLLTTHCFIKSKSSLRLWQRDARLILSLMPSKLV